eukprot:scaffold10251_cov139-Ochromonas_danica.AAC.1
MSNFKLNSNEEFENCSQQSTAGQSSIASPSSPTLLSPAAPHISTDDGQLMLMVERGTKVNLLLSVISGKEKINAKRANFIIKGDNGHIKVPHIITFTDQQVEKDLALFKRTLTKYPNEYEDLVLGVVSFRTLLKAEEGSSQSSFLLSLPQFTTRAFQNLLRIVVLYNSDDDENQGNRDLIIRKLSFLSSAAGNKREEEVKDRVVFMQMKDYCEKGQPADDKMKDNWAKCQRLLQPFLDEASEHNNGKNCVVHSQVLSSVGIYSFYLFGHHKVRTWLCFLLTLLMIISMSFHFIKHQANMLQLTYKLNNCQNALIVSLKQHADISDTVKAKNKENARLSDTVKAKEKENARLSDILKTKDKEITSLSDTVKTKEKDITSLCDTLSAKDKEITSLSDTLRAKDKDITSLSDTVKAKDKEIT